MLNETRARALAESCLSVITKDGCPSPAGEIIVLMKMMRDEGSSELRGILVDFLDKLHKTFLKDDGLATLPSWQAVDMIRSIIKDQEEETWLEDYEAEQ